MRRLRIRPGSRTQARTPADGPADPSAATVTARRVGVSGDRIGLTARDPSARGSTPWLHRRVVVKNHTQVGVERIQSRSHQARPAEG